MDRVVELEIANSLRNRGPVVNGRVPAPTKTQGGPSSADQLYDTVEDNEDDEMDELANSSAAYCWGSGLPAPADPKDGIPKYAGTFRPHHYFDYFFGTSTGG